VGPIFPTFLLFVKEPYFPLLLKKTALISLLFGGGGRVGTFWLYAVKFEK